MSTDSFSDEPKVRNPKKEEHGNARKKLGLDNLHDGFFEETSSSSEDDGVDFQAEELQFSSSGSEKDNNSDVPLKSSDEEELLNLYDKKLREKLTSKKTSKKDESDSNEKMTTRIAEYMKKMRSEEKKLASKLNDGKLTTEDIDRNRKTKEAILKKFDYKDQLKKMKNQGMLTRYESSESENETDSEMEEVVSKLEKMTTKKSMKGKPVTKSSKASKEYDIRKKIEEMKKMVGSPTSSDQIDEHLLQAKMRVADWMKEEEAKSTALKEKFSASGKFATETLMRPPVGRKPLKKADLSRLSEPKNPLPPIKSKKNLGETIKGIKKEDVLKILREAEGPPKPKKSNEKTPDANTLKKIINAPKNPALAKLIQAKNESGKGASKSADLTTSQSPSASKIAERKPILKKSSFKKSAV